MLNHRILAWVCQVHNSQYFCKKVQIRYQKCVCGWAIWLGRIGTRLRLRSSRHAGGSQPKSTRREVTHRHRQPSSCKPLLGYSAETAGMVLSLGALVMFVVMPIVGQMVARTQARYLIAFGWFATAVSMFLSAKTMSLTMSFAS